MGWWQDYGQDLFNFGANAYNSYQQGQANRSAANAQVAGLDRAVDAQMTQYAINNQMADPYRATGTGALNMMAQTAGLPYMPFRSSTELMGTGNPYGSVGGSTSGSNPFSRGTNNAGNLGTTWGITPSNIGTNWAAGGPYAANPGAASGAGGGYAQGSAGNGVINPSGPSMSGFFASPDFNFRLNEGLRAVQNSAAARGGLGGGNSLRAISDYAQGTASGEFADWWNRMSNLAGIGQTATTNQMNSGNQSAANVGNLYGAQGDARASGVLGRSNAQSNGINNWLNYSQARWGS